MYQLPSTNAEIMSFLGVPSLGQILTPKVYTFESEIDFDDTIAAGANQEKEFQNESGNSFVVYALALVPYLPAGSGGAIAGTPAAFDASPTIGNNTFMNLAMFDLQIQTNTLRWSQNKVNAASICGTGTKPAWMLRPRIIPGGQLVRATLYNNSTLAVRARLTFLGYRVQN